MRGKGGGVREGKEGVREGKERESGLGNGKILFPFLFSFLNAWEGGGVRGGNEGGGGGKGRRG